NFSDNTVSVLLGNGDGNFFQAPAPILTGINPSAGPDGISVIISGTGFSGVVEVSFGGVPANFTVNSSTQIKSHRTVHLTRTLKRHVSSSRRCGLWCGRRCHYVSRRSLLT